MSKPSLQTNPQPPSRQVALEFGGCSQGVQDAAATAVVASGRIRRGIEGGACTGTVVHRSAARGAGCGSAACGAGCGSAARGAGCDSAARGVGCGSAARGGLPAGVGRHQLDVESIAACHGQRDREEEPRS